MIIFGTRSTTIGTEPSKTKCRNCETENSTWIVMFQDYFHIFWIPTFPLWKSAVSSCTHCKQALTHKEFNANEKSAYEKIKLNAKTPIWMYSLLIGAVTFIALAVLVAKFEN